MLKKIAIAVLPLFFVACAHHRDVRPGASGTHKVVVQAETTEGASQEAIRQANHFCEKRNKYAAVVKESSKYSGDMDESTYNTAKKASKAAKLVGGAAYVFGGKRESNAGGVLGLGGQVADSVLGNGYTVTMKFQCK